MFTPSVQETHGLVFKFNGVRVDKHCASLRSNALRTRHFRARLILSASHSFVVCLVLRGFHAMNSYQLRRHCVEVCCINIHISSKYPLWFLVFCSERGSVGVAIAWLTLFIACLFELLIVCFCPSSL